MSLHPLLRIHHIHKTAGPSKTKEMQIPPLLSVGKIQNRVLCFLYGQKSKTETLCAQPPPHRPAREGLSLTERRCPGAPALANGEESACLHNPHHGFGPGSSSPSSQEQPCRGGSSTLSAEQKCWGGHLSVSITVLPCPSDVKVPPSLTPLVLPLA